MSAPARDPRTRSRWRPLLWVLLALSLIPTVARVASLVEPFCAPGWERSAFYDFRLWRTGVERYEQTGRLYDTDTPGYFLAGSVSLYKYPPTFAAILKLFAGRPQSTVGRIFLLGSLVLLLLALGVLLVGLRPPPLGGALMALVFVHWMPTWELLSDLRMEPIVLLLLSITLIGYLRGRTWLAGVPAGVAGAFMVYPWALLVPSLLCRHWKVLLGALVGAIGTLAAAALILPARLSMQFFTQILPHLGGTSLSYENLSLLAQLGRVGLLLTGEMPSAAELDLMHLETPDISRLVTAHIIALALLIVVALGIGRPLLRAIRAAGSVPAGRRDALNLALMICVVMPLIPTSWLGYQIILILPLLSLLAWAPHPRSDAVTWGLLIASIVIGTTIYGYGDFYPHHAATSSILRGALPILLGGGLVRVLSGSVARPRAAADPQS